MQNIQKIFGENLRTARKSQGLSQEKLAELASLHRTYIGAVERAEKNISINNIAKLAKVLKVEPFELLKGNK